MAAGYCTPAVLMLGLFDYTLHVFLPQELLVGVKACSLVQIIRKRCPHIRGNVPGIADRGDIHLYFRC